MKRQMAIIAVASTIALMLAGCDSSSAKPDQKNEKDAEITLIAKNEPVEEGEKEQEPSEQVEPEEQKSEENQTTEEKKTEVQTETENSVTGEAETKDNKESDSDSTKPYEYPEDIAEGASVVEHSDGSLTLTVENGEMSVDFPPEWKNHFTVIKRSDSKNGDIEYDIRSKTTYTPESDHTTLIIALIKEEGFYVNAVYPPVGYSNGGYWHIYMRSDNDWNLDNPQQAEESEIIHKHLRDYVLRSFRSRSDSGEMKREFPIVEKAVGHVQTDSNSHKPYCGYSLESILSGGDLVNVWDVEDGWHVTATDAVYDSYNVYINCYDTDDGDKYGWISFWNLIFPDNIG